MSKSIPGSIDVGVDLDVARHITQGDGNKLGSQRVNQVAHGFTVGTVLRPSTTDGEFVKAQANSAAAAAVAGVVTRVVSVDYFEYAPPGVRITKGVPSQVVGTIMYLDPDTAGLMVATAPSVPGQVVKPVLEVLTDAGEARIIDGVGVIVAPDAVSLIDEVFPAGTLATTGTGAAAEAVSPWGDGHVITLSDTDAATESRFDFSMGTASWAAESFQVRMFIAADTANANHVIRLGYSDAGGNSAEEFYNIGTSGVATVAGGVDAGNVVGTPGTLVISRSDVGMVRIDFIMTWSAASGASPSFQVSPAYNLDGTAVADVTSTGSISILSLQMGAAAEFTDGDAEVVQVRNDSSGGVTDYALEAATGLNKVYKFSNADVQSNEARLSVQPGESLNGVTDLEFYFSNYADGTVFEAVSPSVGKWFVAVVGASAETDRAWFAQGVLDDYDPVAGGNWVDFTTLVSAGAFTAQETDEGGWRTSADTLTVPTGFDGIYDVGVTIWHPDAAITGGNNQVGLGGPYGAIEYNGTLIGVGALDSTAGAPESPSGQITMQLNAGDTLRLGYGGGSTETNEDFAVFCAVRPARRKDVVLAGMVVPSDLAFATADVDPDTSIDAGVLALSGLVSHQGAGPTLAANVITLPQSDQLWILEAKLVLDYTSGSSVTEIRFADNVGAGAAIGVQNFAGGFRGNGTGAIERVGGNPYAVIDASAGSVDVVLWNTVAASCELVNGGITIRQEPVSTVVMPDAVPVETLALGAVRTETSQTADAVIAFELQDSNIGSMVTSTTVMTAPADGSYSISLAGTADLDEGNGVIRNLYVVKNNTAPGSDAVAAAAALMKIEVNTGPSEFGVIGFAANSVFPLLAGDTIVVWWAGNTGSDSILSASLIVKREADYAIINPDTVPVNDIERRYLTWSVDQGSGNVGAASVLSVAALPDTNTVSNDSGVFTWDSANARIQVAAGSGRVRVDWDMSTFGSTGGGQSLYGFRADAAGTALSLPAGSLIVDGKSANSSDAGNESSGSRAAIEFDATVATDLYLYVISSDNNQRVDGDISYIAMEQRPGSNVNVVDQNAVVVVDDSANEVITIGGMMFQAGSGTVGTPVTFSTAFSVTPKVVCTADVTLDRIINTSAVTTTGFTPLSWNTGSNIASTGETFDWIAIGQA